MTDLNDLLRQAQAVQAKLGEKQAELARRTVTGAAGGGMVTATVNGAGEVVGVTLDKQCVDPRDVGMLQDLIVAAIRDGQARAKDLQSEALGPLSQLLSGGLGGLGGGGLGFKP